MKQTIKIQENRGRDDGPFIWRDVVYDLDNPKDIAAYIARYRYTWPGGYEMLAITDDGGALCNDCCRTEYRRILQATPGDGFYVDGYSIDEDHEGAIYCDHCGRTITEETD